MIKIEIELANSYTSCSHRILSARLSLLSISFYLGLVKHPVLLSLCRIYDLPLVVMVSRLYLLVAKTWRVRQFSGWLKFVSNKKAVYFINASY